MKKNEGRREDQRERESGRKGGEIYINYNNSNNNNNDNCYYYYYYYHNNNMITMA